MTLIEQEPGTFVYGFPGYRYQAALSRVEVSSSFKRYGVLDVGGFRDNRLIEELLPGAQVLSLNIANEPHGRTGDIIYDGEKMPLADNSFPMTMAVDVLEHVPFSLRFNLVKEMTRVASQQIVIAGPFHSRENIDYEEKLLATMKENRLPPKTSIAAHRGLGLPRIEELVSIVRRLRLPFNLYPATIAALEFQGLLTQVEVLAKNNLNTEKTQGIAEAVETQLENAPLPTWSQAYRAILVIDKIPQGKIVGETELSYSTDEKTAYQTGLVQAGWGYIKDPISFFKENPLRGRHIAFEGPDGSGKTTVMNLVAQHLQNLGYQIAIPTNFGLRSDIRKIEKEGEKLIEEPAREQLLTIAMIQAQIGGNAYTLAGPCSLSLCDRTLASVEVHHLVHGEQPSVSLLLNRAPEIPPDLTIVLEVDDLEENELRMRENEDLANMQITQEHLEKQRHHYARLEENRYTGSICWIKNNGPLESTVTEVLEAIEGHCGIPTSTILHP